MIRSTTLACIAIAITMVGALVGSGPCLAAEPAATSADFAKQWQKTMDAGDSAKTRLLCEAAKSSPGLKVEALVCLANLELKAARQPAVEVDLAALGMQPGESRGVSPEALRKAVKDVPLWDDALVGKALADLDEAIGLEPTRGDLWQGKAHLLRLVGRRADLNAHLARAAREWPGATLAALAAYGREYFEAGDMEAAADVLEALAAVYPANFEIWSDAGAANAATGRYEHALELFSKAEKLGDDDLLLVNIANVNIRLGRFEKALPYLTRTYERNADAWTDQARLILGLAAVKGEDAKPLLKDVKHAAGSGVDKVWNAAMTRIDADFALSLAQQAYESRDNELALLALANAKDAPRALFLRAGVYEALGRYETSASDLEAFLAAATEAERAFVPRAESNLGLTLMRLARPKDAVPHFVRAVELGVADSAVYDTLGRAQEQLGNAAEALAAFDAAVKANTDSDAVERSRLAAARIRKAGSPGAEVGTKAPGTNPK